MPKDPWDTIHHKVCLLPVKHPGHYWYASSKRYWCKGKH